MDVQLLFYFPNLYKLFQVNAAAKMLILVICFTAVTFYQGHRPDNGDIKHFRKVGKHLSNSRAQQLRRSAF
jgi:hypothetical protein